MIISPIGLPIPHPQAPGVQGRRGNISYIRTAYPQPKPHRSEIEREREGGGESSNVPNRIVKPQHESHKESDRKKKGMVVVVTQDNRARGNLMVDVLKIKLNRLIQPAKPQISHLLNLVH